MRFSDQLNPIRIQFLNAHLECIKTQLEQEGITVVRMPKPVIYSGGEPCLCMSAYNFVVEVFGREIILVSSKSGNGFKVLQIDGKEVESGFRFKPSTLLTTIQELI